MTDPAPRFDPYALLEALGQRRIGYLIVGAFARVVHGSGETTRGLDIVPSLREVDLRRLARTLEELGASERHGGPINPAQIGAEEKTVVRTRAGEVAIVPTPWGTRGYDDLRIRANRENLGRGLRPAIASVVDLARMLEASPRLEDVERLHRLQRMMEIDRQLSRERRLKRGLSIER